MKNVILGLPLEAQKVILNRICQKLQNWRLQVINDRLSELKIFNHVIDGTI